MVSPVIEIALGVVDVASADRILNVERHIAGHTESGYCRGNGMDKCLYCCCSSAVTVRSA